jgi:hypothetical protein
VVPGPVIARRYGARLHSVRPDFNPVAIPGSEDTFNDNSDGHILTSGILADEFVNHPEEPILLLAHADKYLLEEARRALEPVSAEAAEELLGTVGHEDPSQDQPQNQQRYVFHSYNLLLYYSYL